LDPSKTNAGYEKRDVNTRGILYFALALFLVLVASFVSMRFVFGYFFATQPLGPAATPFNSSRELPPDPRLQPDPAGDLNQVRQAQEELLNSYGWVDRANGNIRIPVDRAMDLVIKRGLPARGNPPQPGPSDKEPQK
jgi:hypothetical protein